MVYYICHKVMDSNYIDMLKYYIDMLKCLNKARVDYIMVGGWAINLYGYIRATVDLDLWILADRANAKKVYSAFGEFGAPIADIEPDEFADEGHSQTCNGTTSAS